MLEFENSSQSFKISDEMWSRKYPPRSVLIKAMDFIEMDWTDGEKKIEIG